MNSIDSYFYSSAVGKRYYAFKLARWVEDKVGIYCEDARIISGRWYVRVPHTMMNTNDVTEYAKNNEVKMFWAEVSTLLQNFTNPMT